MWFRFRGKWLVSRGGGVQSRWRRDGKELFYIWPDSKLMAVEVKTRPEFQSGTPQALFMTDLIDTGIRTAGELVRGARWAVPIHYRELD